MYMVDACAYTPDSMVCNVHVHVYVYRSLCHMHAHVHLYIHVHCTLYLPILSLHLPVIVLVGPTHIQKQITLRKLVIVQSTFVCT